MREKLIELPRQLRYCAADKDCRNCERRNVSCGSRYCVDDLMLKAAELLESIANGVTIATDNNVGDKWIPVSERLPETQQRVLVYCESKTIEKHVTVCTYMGGYLGSKQFSRHVRNVTHWMPLPLPPKEGE